MGHYHFLGVTYWPSILKPTWDHCFSLPMKNATEIDYRYMPFVGNGHLATTVLSDWIFVNGVYNGALGKQGNRKSRQRGCVLPYGRHFHTGYGIFS